MQICQCGVQAGYPHAEDCPYPYFPDDQAGVERWDHERGLKRQVLRSYADEDRRRPTQEQLEEWLEGGGCEATDGCWVEPDGTCQHGCESWRLVMGLI